MRQSNMELLRIVSMLMVLTVHADGASLGLPDLSGNLTAATSYDFWRLAVESLAIIGVNCFTMISGYFGIRLKWRGVASFLFQCLFYAVGIYVAVCVAFPTMFSLKELVDSCMVLTHTDLWYVPTYFGLMLLSPVLNAGLEALDRRQFSIVLAAFVLFNVWCGWWWEGSFNPTGYTLVQLILVYMVGMFLRLHVDTADLCRRRAVIVAGYVLSTVGVFVSSLYLEPGMAFAYNSPLVLASTVGLFMLFMTIDMRSRTINYVAKSAFAAYLIHKSPFIWGNVMRPMVLRLKSGLPGWEFVLAAAGVVVAFYIIAMVVDPLRRLLSKKIFS